MEIVWDEPKRLANLDKHGLDFADLNETFFDTALVVPSRPQALGRDRRQYPGRYRRRVRKAGRRGREYHQHAAGEPE
jgi:uncharacterized DUF497 family protein